MNDPDDVAGRLRELESQAAFQDELHARLNEVVARQDLEISLLKKQVEALSRRLQELGEAAADMVPGQGEELPPHY